MAYLRQPPPAFGFGRAGPAVLQPILSGPYWSQWPDKFTTGQVVHKITIPSAEGGTIGGLGDIQNNLAKMIKWFENRQREWGKGGAERMRTLGYKMVDGKWVLS